ncbi:helix-turn-helix protein [Lachnotalea glycerini]|uniref:Helix-turn-helix protein n=1 Tax=Lachnotalea glycerini TaxID=1763509 RepID=A0A318ELR0_9FIRM|nr:helix-turn-helix domain-containing protein [Lachnotalea glycerini]PXV85133.1 helix-turn-helix protein [Lachnotalea glycerini]
MNEFSKRLKKLREKRNLSLSELALSLGLAKSLLWRYEAGKSEPGLSTLITLAEYFEVTLDWIAGNGDINSIQYKNYENAINKCVKEDITPEKLEKLIDVIKE